MLPLRDVIPSRTVPWVTGLLVGLNTLAFLYEIALGPLGRLHLVYSYGLVPAEFHWTTAVSSLFIHAGWLHLVGNLLALWIFGDNVEDQMGHGRFALFYFVAGVTANILQVHLSPGSSVPLIGASGAIAGLVGAYFVMFPTSRILVLIYLLVFVDMVEVPAVVFLSLWVLTQLLSGLGQLAGVPVLGTGFWTLAGGCAIGVVGVWLLRRPERRRVDWWG